MAKHSAVEDDAVGGRLLVKEIYINRNKKAYPTHNGEINSNYFYKLSI